MTALARVDLPALKGHHPLGFLAACGLLQVVSQSYPAALGWQFDARSGHWTALLQSAPTTVGVGVAEAIIVMVARAAAKLVKSLDKAGIKKADDFRVWAEQVKVRPLGVDESNLLTLLSAIHGDFAMTSGNQDFISGLRRVAARVAMPISSEEPPERVHAAIHETLYGPWLYNSREHALGWDPRGQRLHALRNMAPTNDANKGSVVGAVFLASQAMTLLPCFNQGHATQTTGFYREAGGKWLCWPIWPAALTVDAVRSLLAQPFSIELRKRGVEVVYRSPQVHTGGPDSHYRTLGQVSVRPWP